MFQGRCLGVALSYKDYKMLYTGSWHIDYAVDEIKFYVPTEEEKALAQAKAEAARVARDTEARACQRLWQNAVNSILVRYPDPRVTVDLAVTTIDTVGPITEIDFRLFNLRDTSNPDLPIANNAFRVPCAPFGWPSLYVAQIYLASFWSIFLMHEAQELVTYRGTDLNRRYRAVENGRYVDRYAAEPVIDSHEFNGASQTAIHGTRNIANTLDWGLGHGKGHALVVRHADAAKRELQNEIDYLTGPRSE